MKAADSRFWRDDARCLEEDVDPEVFFSVGSIDRAKELCRACPVQLKCLDDALADPTRKGIAGGVTERNRRNLRGQRRREAAAAS